MKTTINKFKSKASQPEQGLVVIFDLEGFSKFFSQPDVKDYVPMYLNIVLSAISLCFEGGEAYWTKGKDDEFWKMSKLHSPMHSKFLGDGALYIWKYNDFTENQRKHLINRLWLLKNNFNKVTEKALDDIPILDIPKNIRFGIAAGTVHKLTYLKSNKEEYIGYSINLASRLQSYCRDIGLSVSGRINIKTKNLESSDYIKVVAKAIKGFPQEIVIVDKNDYDDLEDEVRDQLFDEL